MTHTLNREAFALFVHVNGQKAGHQTIQQTADAAGISKAQFFRALHKQPIAIEAFLSLCLWMKANPFSFLLDATTGRGLAPLPEADVSRDDSTETRAVPRSRRAA